MNIAIIDDDREFQSILTNKLNEYFHNATIYCYDDIKEKIIDYAFDIIFLDVMLEDKESFQEGEHLLRNNTSTLLVYMSSMDHFVYNSYEQRAFFFMRKLQLDDSLNRFIQKYKKIEKERLQYITFDNENQYILQKDMICLEVFRNQVIIQSIQAQYSVYKSLKKIYLELDTNNFYKLNRYTVINLEHIKEYNNQQIQLTNGISVLFTRGNFHKFQKAYLEYRSRKLWNGY